MRKRKDELEILTLEDKDKSKKKFKLNFKFNKFKSIPVVLLFLLVLVFFSFKTNLFKGGVNRLLAFAGVYTEEIKKVEIESNDYDDAGSWHIDKSAEWIGNGKARIKFDLNTIMKTDDNYKDIILVLDISGSMEGEKLDKAKSDSIELINAVLSDSHNKMALIKFESTSSIVSNFSNDKDDLVDKVNALTTTGSTNYNSGLLNVDEVMTGYERSNNRDVVTLFLTDGYPNLDTPLEVGTYAVLKDKYPYMTINGVQYEMGTDIIDEITRISDGQWVADRTTLNNVLFEAAVAPTIYDTFKIEDYIDGDYFEVENVSKIETSRGEVTLGVDNGLQKITWDLGNSFYTGTSAEMTIEVNLKSQYLDTKGFYPTNDRENIISKLPNESQKTKNSTLTPVLKNKYLVNYDVNTPSDCDLEEIESEEHFVYQNVNKKTDELICNGYLFKGWEIDEEDSEDITMVNDDVFVMPGHDVTIRATWTKQSISKSMDGTVHEKATLYKVLQQEAQTGTYARKYTGDHQDSMDVSQSTQDIYYWYGSNDTNGIAILDKNNVIFANHCWQMIRTTDTGGVKMIYNGEVEDGKCLDTRGNHVGYASRTSQSLNSNYWYGTDYTYNTSTSSFQIAGTTEQTTWNATTGPNLIGKYTCKQTTESGTCTTLYLVESYYNTTSAYVIPLNASSNYSQFGTLQFNVNYTSPADVGYMYNTRYTYNSKATNTETVLSSYSLGITYWYADSVTWGSPTLDRYNLDNPYQVSSESDYPSLVGKYTFRNTTQSYTNTSVYYIAAVNGSDMYYIQLSNSGNYTLSDFNYTYTYGDSYTDNGNGTYTINNPTTINRSDWYSNYSNVGAGKYVCKNATNNTCSELWYTTSTSNTSMSYIKVENVYKYAKGFTYNSNTGTYTLNNDNVSFWDISDSTNKSSIDTHHYTCWNESGECTTLSYIYYISGTTPYYVNLTGGKSVSDALGEMLSNDNINSINSTMKSGIDAWYKKYLLDYDAYIEDTIFCNDRSIRALNGWNPDGGSTSNYLQFKEYNVTSDLSCTNITDRFSVSNNKAQLTYKVGLMSSPEMNLLGNANVRKARQYYWLASPNYFSYSSAGERVVLTAGYLGGFDVLNDYGARPAVSLSPGIEYSSGDGSRANPYVVDAQVNPYVYSISGTTVGPSSNISEIGTYYSSPEEAASNFGKSIFLRHEVANNIITANSVSFVKDGTTYYIQGGGATINPSTGDYNSDSIYFDSNKQVMNTAFGSSNCSDHNTWYQCSSNGLFVGADAIGYVVAGNENTSWQCSIDVGGGGNCHN